MNRWDRFSNAMSQSAIVWGGLASAAFYGLIRFAAPRSSIVVELFAAHPIEYAATTMFFIGLAALALKSLDVAGQWRRLAKLLLGPVPPDGQALADCEALVGHLNRLPREQQNDYRVRRLRDALEHVRRTGSADNLEGELKYLSDLDAARAHAGSGLVRVIIWAIPILGFMGTVIGIIMALDKLAPEALETSLPTVMQALSVAFNTTLQALGLCTVLMFALYFTDKRENALLAQVDRRVEEELTGRFEQIPQGPGGELAAVRRMVQRLIDATEGLVLRQVELWQGSMDAAQKRWSSMAAAAAETLQEALAGALAESLKAHARELSVAEQAAGENNRRHWLEVQQALVRNTETVGELQTAVIRKAEVLGRATAAADQVIKLQETLNANLKALAGAKNFEQTVMSLAAAIHLLNARLEELPSETSGVQLEVETSSQTGQAA